MAELSKIGIKEFGNLIEYIITILAISNPTSYFFIGSILSYFLHAFKKNYSIAQ